MTNRFIGTDYQGRTLDGFDVHVHLPTADGPGYWMPPPEDAVRLIGDTIEYSLETLPRCNPVSVCGYHIRESGANPAQEIGFALEMANAYIDEAVSRGLAVDDVARRITFNFNIFGNLWEQVAKFRAARKLWAKNLKEEYGAKNPKSMHLRGLFGGGGLGRYGLTMHSGDEKKLLSWLTDQCRWSKGVKV